MSEEYNWEKVDPEKHEFGVVRKQRVIKHCEECEGTGKFATRLVPGGFECRKCEACKGSGHVIDFV